jgi:hypothetical protein
VGQSLICCATLSGASQQVGDRVFARVCHEAYQAGRASLQTEAIGLYKESIASGHVA